MSLEHLSEHIRAFADTQSQDTAPIDVEALAEELEALAAIFTNDHDDDSSMKDGDDEDAGSGAFQVLQVDDPVAPEVPRSEEGNEGSVDFVSRWRPGSRLRLMLNTSIQAGPDEAGDKSGPTSSGSIPIRLSITIPPSYPIHADASEEAQQKSSPPQLQLLSRYIGAYAVDPTLFGSVLRTFLHYHPSSDERAGSNPAQSATFPSSPSDERPLTSRHDTGPRGKNEGVPWNPGEPLLYEGIEYVRDLVADWYENRRLSDRHRAKERQSSATRTQFSRQVHDDGGRRNGHHSGGPADSVPTSLEDKEQSLILKRLVRTEPVTERKSVFIAHAARLDHPDEVPVVLAHILSDRKIARASHPIIHAWVCTLPTDGKAKGDSGSTVTVHRDHDDDGETAAGGRLAHLLDLLDVPNALIVVTRWYGGVLLGADRFKFINRVARNGLEKAGLVAP